MHEKGKYIDIVRRPRQQISCSLISFHLMKLVSIAIFLPLSGGDAN